MLSCITQDSKSGVSIVIPTYNREMYLKECINSILTSNTDKIDWEIIIVDDGSTDRTREMVSELNNRRIRYIYQDNRGVASALNTGIRSAAKDYIVIQASDNITTRDGIITLVSFLDAHPDVGFCYGQCYTIDSAGQQTREKFPRGPKSTYVSCGRDEYLRLLYGTKSIDCHATRRECFDTVGLFNESYKMSEDWDMLFRLTAKYNVGHIAVPVGLVRNHDNSLTTTTKTEDAIRVHGDIIRNALRTVEGVYTVKQYRSIVKKSRCGMYLLFARTYGRNHQVAKGRKYLIMAMLTHPSLMFDYKTLLKTLKEFIPGRYKTMVARSLVKAGVR